MLSQNKMITLKLNLQKALAIPLTVNNYFLHPVYLSQANILPFYRIYNKRNIQSINLHPNYKCFLFYITQAVLFVPLEGTIFSTNQKKIKTKHWMSFRPLEGGPSSLHLCICLMKKNG